MIQRPKQIKIIGNLELGRQFIGQAKSQMNILINQMKFQNLNQGVRRLWLNRNIHVECIKIYGSELCVIRAKQVVDQIQQAFESTVALLIVVGNSEQLLNLTNVNGVFEVDESISGGTCSGDITSVKLSSGIGQIISGNFTDCTVAGTDITGSISGATGKIESCKDWYFQKAYEYYEFLETPPVLDTLNDEYEIFSALDNSPPAEFECGVYDDIVATDWKPQEWTKIHGQFMLTAFTYRTAVPDMVHIVAPEDDEFYDEFFYWKVAASYNGQTTTIDGQENYGPFRRSTFAGRLNSDSAEDYKGQAKLHIGFDLWQDEFDDYWISVMSDLEETLYVFKFNPDTNNCELQDEYLSHVRSSYYIGQHTYWYFLSWTYDFEYAHKQVRLLGYGYDQDTNEHVAYWSDIQNYSKECHFSFSTVDCRGWCSGYYYKEILNTGEITEYVLEDQHIRSAIWDPIKRRPYLLFIDWVLDTCDIEKIPDVFHSYYIKPEYGSVGDLVYETGWQLEMPVACLAALDVPLGGSNIAFTKGDLIGSGYWLTFEESDMTRINYLAKTFPHDDGWTSILFNGTDRSGNEYENWIIYKDIAHEEDDPAYEGYFAISDTGTKYPIGTYDRAFFYNFTTTEEVE